MYCKNCGKEITNNDAFCPNCGKEISTNQNISLNSIKETEDRLEKIYSLLAKSSLIIMIVAFHSYIALIGLVIGITSIVIAVINKVKYKYPLNGLSLAVASSGILANLFIFIFLIIIV